MKNKTLAREYIFGLEVKQGRGDNGGKKIRPPKGAIGGGSLDF